MNVTRVAVLGAESPEAKALIPVLRRQRELVIVGYVDMAYYGRAGQCANCPLYWDPVQMTYEVNPQVLVAPRFDLDDSVLSTVSGNVGWLVGDTARLPESDRFSLTALSEEAGAPILGIEGPLDASDLFTILTGIERATDTSIAPGFYPTIEAWGLPIERSGS